LLPADLPGERKVCDKFCIVDLLQLAVLQDYVAFLQLVVACNVDWQRVLAAPFLNAHHFSQCFNWLLSLTCVLATAKPRSRV
jgi:hypothetical protein